MIASDRNLADVRFPVQWVIRPMSDEHHDYRGYAGQVAGGVLRAGDEVVVLPGGQRTRIDGDRHVRRPLEAAFPTMSVTVRLADDLDISRGDMIVEADDPPIVARELEADALLDERAAAASRARATRSSTRRAPPARVVEELDYRVDVNTLGARARRRSWRSTRSAACALRSQLAADGRSLRAQPDAPAASS